MNKKISQSQCWEKELSKIGALATLAIDDCEKAKQANLLAEEKLKAIGQKIEELYISLENTTGI